MKAIKVYPLGVIEAPFTFCDILDIEGNHICCVSWVGEEDNIDAGMGVGVHWDEDGYPDIIVEDKWVTFDVMKKALETLEKDPRNKYRYNLIRKNWFELFKIY